MKAIKFLTLLMICISLVGCEEKQEVIKKEEVKETLNIINIEDINLTMVKPKTINPVNNTDKTVGYVLSLIYDGLFSIDENYNLVPQLVNEYSISQDGKSINLSLKDATWHDGKPITSYDVKFTVDTIKKNQESSYYKLVENISQVSVIDNKIFRIEFINNYSFSVDTLIFPIIPKHKLEGATDINDCKFNLVGSGKYKIEAYQERKYMKLVVNENYYKKSDIKSKNINVEIVPDEEAQSAMVLSLNSDISKVDLNDLSKFYEEEFKIVNFEGRDYESVIFNYNNEFIRDVNFRRAIVSCINRQRVLEEAYIGDATVVDFPLNSKSKYYTTSKSINYNIDNAKKYLNNIKLQKTDTTGATTSSNVYTQEEVKNKLKQLNLKIIVNIENSERIKTAHIISQGLKEIGIKSDVIELTPEDMDKALIEKQYDLALVGWELSSIPDATNIIQSIGYTDDKLQGYINSLRSSASENQIKDIYKSIQNYVNDNALFMSLVIRNDYIVINQRLKGKITPNSFNVYDGISNLEI